MRWFQNPAICKQRIRRTNAPIVGPKPGPKNSSFSDNHKVTTNCAWRFSLRATREKKSQTKSKLGPTSGHLGVGRTLLAEARRRQFWGRKTVPISELVFRSLGARNRPKKGPCRPIVGCRSLLSEKPCFFEPFFGTQTQTSKPPTKHFNMEPQASPNQQNT